MKQTRRWHVNEAEDEDLLFTSDGSVRKDFVDVYDEELEGIYARAHASGSEPLGAVPPAPAMLVDRPAPPPMPERVILQEPASLSRGRTQTSIDDIVKLMLSNHASNESWNAKTASQATAAVMLFKNYLEAFHDVRCLEDIEQEHIDGFNEVLLSINPRHGKAASDRTFTFRAYVEKYCTRYQGPPFLSGPTRNRHWTFLSQLLRKAKRKGVKLRAHDLSDFRAKKDGRSRNARAVPEVEAIRGFFRLPVFTGCLGWDYRSRGAHPCVA